MKASLMLKVPKHGLSTIILSKGIGGGAKRFTGVITLPKTIVRVYGNRGAFKSNPVARKMLGTNASCGNKLLAALRGRDRQNGTAPPIRRVRFV
jgi:hypothetical protein